ncbi:N-acetylneuraminate lyase-like isoform X2 [Babylonia areolata]|uniref:N-acetylneuraminate lyase-like isoform X2 n=1 Tax=Babylonia areolata TaxID=304850 RepID=UPI003FD64EDF
MEDFTLTGFVAATFTPMKENGDVNYDAVDDYCQFLHDDGITQVYVNGSTGEGPSLTIEERMRLTECWVKAGRREGRLTRIIIQVGGACLTDSMAMARHAESLGVDAISTLPPLYFPVSSTRDLVDHCRKIAAEAPTTPMYYYHIPCRSVSMPGFLEAARAEIPTLRGVKFSDKDLVEMCACLRTLDNRGRPFNVLFGCDEQVMSALVLGADGAIGSTYNFLSGLNRRLVALLDKGDVTGARAEQYRSQDVVKEMFKFGAKTNGILSTLKAAMSLVGMDLGPPRPPMRSLETEDQEAFFKALTDLGFLGWRK